MADEEEYDFDDPRFLIEAPSSTKELSYAEKRKRKLASSFDKGRTHQRSRKQQEEDARAEGLATNLIARDTLEGESKALRMMKGMGFTPGEGLGKKRKVDGEDEGPTPSGSEPIKFHMREGRTGLGVPGSSKSSSAFPPSVLAAAEAARAANPLPDINLYLSRNLGLFNERKAFGILRSVRKTLEELDRRAGIEDSVMWKAPEDQVRDERRDRAKRAFRGGDVDPDEDWGVDVKGEREEQDRGRGLDYEKGLSGVVVDEDGDGEEGDEAKLDREEEAEWLAFDSPVRLALTLAYLRNTYNYCFWCGCQYNDKDDLKTSCPGEDEQDH
ncbi:hypothetical protein RQP46_007529 [Phenoliferia psychrophenolica]